MPPISAGIADVWGNANTGKGEIGRKAVRVDSTRGSALGGAF